MRIKEQETRLILHEHGGDDDDDDDDGDDDNDKYLTSFGNSIVLENYSKRKLVGAS